MPCIMDQREVLDHLANCPKVKGLRRVPGVNGATGVDAVFALAGSDMRIYCEAIGFTSLGDGRPHGKNQTDFWKGFAQAISRPTNHETEGCAIAMPIFFLPGWSQRRDMIGREAWDRIGGIFGNLKLIFVHHAGNIIIQGWKEAWSAHQSLTAADIDGLRKEKKARLEAAKTRIAGE